MTRTIAIALVLLFAIPVLDAANNTAVTVTIVKQSPIETLSSDGTVRGVKEAAIGTRLKLVSVAGSEVTLQDDQQTCYRIAISATDYTVASAGSLNTARSQGAPSQTLASVPTPARPAPLRTDSTLLNQGWKFLRLNTSTRTPGDDQAAPGFLLGNRQPPPHGPYRTARCQPHVAGYLLVSFTSPITTRLGGQKNLR
jgi:hypothetical protein